MSKTRIDRLMEILSRLRLSGIVVTDMKNIRYLSGFTGSDGALVVGESGAMFLTDGRYTTQAAGEVTSFPVTEYRNKIQGIVDAVGALKMKRVGVESHAMSLFFFKAIKSRLPGRGVVPVEEDLALLRMVKDHDEIDAIRESIRISEESFEQVTQLITAGTREDEIAVELEYAMKKRGSGVLPFPIIVAAGKNGALPHAHAGARRLEAGSLVTIDFGAQYRGYHSDQTVTVMVGRDGGKEREVHGVVLEAQRRAIAGVRPGVPTKDVDAIARDYIKDRGYGEYFTHGTGHGVGLDVHEPPAVSPLGKEVLQEGMIVTVEPGIYIPGWGGVRIEDMVLVEKTAPCILTTVPKSFRVLS
jgi:Xaa-Pro aminopeptidase/Xaa-Pro dipeptidase